MIPGLAKEHAEDHQRRQDLHALPPPRPQVLRRRHRSRPPTSPTRSNALFKVNSGGSPFYTDIVGAEKFAETKKGGIPGIETNDKTGEIVIHLTKPRGTFTNELALMFVAPVPPDTPNTNQSTNPPPATGPYMITKAEPGQGWYYERNPYWAKANSKAMPELPSGHVDKINVTIIRNPSTQVNDIEQGKLDWMQTQPPPDRYPEVKSKYEGTQFRVEQTISTYYFWMNTTKPPFDDLKVRQAVNYAVDPAALERIYVGQLAGTQQILPPGMPGYKKFELYPHEPGQSEGNDRRSQPLRPQHHGLGRQRKPKTKPRPPTTRTC